MLSVVQHREIFEIFQKYFVKYFMKYFRTKNDFTSLRITGRNVGCWMNLLHAFDVDGHIFSHSFKFLRSHSALKCSFTRVSDIERA